MKTTGVGGPERGYDGAKRLSGRKRHLLVDTGGLVLSARVHAASLHDRDGAQGLLTDELKKELPQSWSWSGLTERTRTSCAGGPKKSEGGGSRYRTIVTGSFGASP